jgi:tRNA threonylcarbamoyl adenosine modification protein YeaZ
MFLYINTAERESIELAMFDEPGLVVKKVKQPSQFQHSEKILKLIDELIGGHKNLKKLDGIIVVQGPGGFTSLRIGVTVANTLSWTLNIPVYPVDSISLNKIEKKFKDITGQKKKIALAIPKYGSEPNITKKELTS